MAAPQTKIGGLAISSASKGKEEDDFVFGTFANSKYRSRNRYSSTPQVRAADGDTDTAFAVKTPQLNKYKEPEQTTPITQLQNEILDENSPTVSIDSMGFKKIQPLAVSRGDTDDVPVTTSPLKLRKSRAELGEYVEQQQQPHQPQQQPQQQPISNSTSAQTLNTFYSAHSIHSSASETSRDGIGAAKPAETDDDDDDDVFKSTLNVHLLAGDADNSHSTTLDTETLLEDVPMSSPSAARPASPQAGGQRSEARFLMFTNQFSDTSHTSHTGRAVSTLTTKTTASSYYGEYNDGYMEDPADNDKTPLVSKFGGDKFDEIVQEENGEQFDDLNRTPLVRQIGFENNRTPRIDETEVSMSTPQASSRASSASAKTPTQQQQQQQAAAAHTQPPLQRAPSAKKSSATTGGKFLSKFRSRFKANGHARGQSVNESVKSQHSGKDDLTSMDPDSPLSEQEYQEYASKVTPPPPPPGAGADVEEFDFVSPSGVVPQEGSTSSTLEQRSASTEKEAQAGAVAGDVAEALAAEDADDDLYHAYKPAAGSIDGVLQQQSRDQSRDQAQIQPDAPAAPTAPAAPVQARKTDEIEQYEDGDEVHIEQLDKNGYAVSVDNKADLKLSPAKSIRRSFQAKDAVKSPNELNKDIFESFRPSYAQPNVAASPSSSRYTDDFSPATNEFSIGTSQLDRRDFVSPTESTFSGARGEKRHTTVKLLNRSTTNLVKSAAEVPIVEDGGVNDPEYEDIDDAEEPLGSGPLSAGVYRKYANQRDIVRELENTDDDNFARLFLTATHPFDAATLESQDEAARCLSFGKDDIAFIHDISESSGWAEVTLLSLRIETGWVPLNYFKPTIDDDDKQPLLLLFKSAGNFLANRQSRAVYSSRNGDLKGYSFPYTAIDKITVGVKYFLSEIGCLSSKNETVYLSKTIREVRKKLLQDWHILRQKSREYVGTVNVSKIELLELLVFQVLVKAIMFLSIWRSENVFKTKTNLDRFRIDNKARPYLTHTPALRERIKEDSTVFISYLCLIMGRMDLIEHNLTGVSLLAIIRQQIDLLAQDFDFVVREAVKRLREAGGHLEQLGAFVALVERFDQDCERLSAATRREYGARGARAAAGQAPQASDAADPDAYLYTEDGRALLQTCALMVVQLNKVMAIEIQISRERLKDRVEHPYIDFQKRKIDAKDFVQQASLGLLESNRFNGQLGQRRNVVTSRSQHAKRFSVMRSGRADALALTPEGVDLLGEMVAGADAAGVSPMFGAGEFQALADEDLTENPYYIKNLNNEIVKDASGVLIGSSFRGLVFFLTNELDEPSQLYVSTFFLCFRTFSTGADLLDSLITRFAAGARGPQGVSEIRMKNRRRLVLRMLTVWLSSYWHRQDDFRLLPKLVNFLNECASDALPLETLQLVRLVCTLVVSEGTQQLVPRPLLPADEPHDRRFSTVSMAADDDDYELTLIQSNESLNSLASVSSATMSKSDVAEMDAAVARYRAAVGASWRPHTSLDDLVANWYHVRTSRLRFPAKPFALVELHAADIAEQLTLIESDMFNRIRIEELLDENFTDKKLHLNLSPNVRRSILFTNSLSEYVLETVLQPEIGVKQRAKILTRWLKVALNCFNLKNFNSLAAVMTSLQSFLLSRCVKIWSHVGANYKRLFDKLIKIIQPDKNYLIYRRKLMNYLNDKDQTIVPYLNLFLHDLTFIVEGNSNFRSAKTFLNQKLVNIDKYFKITKILGDLQKLQKDYKPSAGALRKSGSASRIRRSLSRLSLSSTTDLVPEMADCLPLQELVFLELLRVRQLNAVDDDRSWKLSCMIQPRET